jgi:GNAT superfamily N-acetyltransferase
LDKQPGKRKEDGAKAAAVADAPKPRASNAPLGKLTFYPLTPDRLADFETLFGARGACGGCWCMFWMQSRKEFDANKGEKNKRAMRALVRGGREPGILAYSCGEPVGWCAVGPREGYKLLENSRVLRRVDDKPVWSIVCFFIAKRARRRGVSEALIEAALKFAKKRGAKIVEGYPVEPRKDRMPDVFAWTGFYSAFRNAGFREVGRRSESRPILRYEFGANKKP